MCHFARLKIYFLIWGKKKTKAKQKKTQQNLELIVALGFHSFCKNGLFLGLCKVRNDSQPYSVAMDWA